MIIFIFILFLITFQVYLLFRGFSRIKKYIFDLCGYLNLLFFVFFVIPAWDLYFDTHLFDHRIVDYGVAPSRDSIIYYIAIVTIIAALFDLGYQLGTGRLYSFSDNRRLIDIDNSIYYHQATYTIVLAVLAIIWFLVMYYAYRSFGRSLILFLLPSRKQDTYSSVISLMQLAIPDIILSLTVIRNWDKKDIIKSALIPIMMVLVTVSSNNQRREIIQGIVFCGLLVLMKYFKVLKDRNGFENFLRKKPWGKYARIGILATVALIPLLWYARSFSNQIVRGGVTVNPFTLHSFTDLIFGSSTTGFDTTLIIDQYDKAYGGLFFHCIRFFFMFWIPRSIYPNKPMQITQMIKVSRGDWGNLSTFYVNDLFFSFKLLSFIFVPLCGALVSRIYNKASSSRNIDDAVFSIYIFSQIILLFKNGFSVFLTRIAFFWVLYQMVSFVCKHIKVQR